VTFIGAPSIHRRPRVRPLLYQGRMEGPATDTAISIFVGAIDPWTEKPFGQRGGRARILGRTRLE